MIYYNIIDNKKVFFESDVIFADYEATLANTEEQKEYYFEKAKQSKFAEIKAKRDEALNKNITFDNKEYKGTENARTLFCTRFNLGVFPIKWRFADDISWISLNKEEATGLANAFLDDSSSMYQKETNFLIALNQATTIENINNIIINY